MQRLPHALLIRLQCLVKVPARMHHASHLRQPTRSLEKGIVDHIGVRLQIPLISLQKSRRPGAPSRRCVIVEHHRMVYVSHIRPDPPRPGKRQLPVQHLHARIVGPNYFRRKQHLLGCLIQRLHQFGHHRQPAPHRLARDPHALALEDPLLPVQRLMVGVLAHDHLRQHARSRRALLDRLRGLFRRFYSAIASVLPPHILDDLDRGWDVLVALARLFGDQPQILAAAIAMLLGFAQIVHDPFPDYILGQRLAPTPLPGL